MAEIAARNNARQSALSGSMGLVQAGLKSGAIYDRYKMTVPVTMDQKNYNAEPGVWGGSNESEGSGDPAQEREGWGGSNESEGG
jgi:hypothetical protein